MRKWVSIAVLLLPVACCHEVDFGVPVAQTDISRVSQMPSFPQPYKMLDWKQKEADFDAYVFDEDSELPAGPVIWFDNKQRNFPQETFGIYTAIGDARQGPDNNGGEFHESLNTLHILLGAGLNGRDKTDEKGRNYVRMVQNYFNSDTGWDIMMNNTCPEVAMLGGGYGRDWWYDVYPNLLYYAICDVYPGVENAEFIQHSIAEKFCAADSVLAGNYDYSFFDYANLEGKVSWIPLQQDAAGGHAWVLYAAYQKWGDPRYLEHAKSAMDALSSQSESRFYEILLPMGIYTAARLNAEQGCDYDLAKMLDWVFDGCTSETGRTGWGVTLGRWGDYDISGLQGDISYKGGYAFMMNSMDLAWPFIAMVKYAPEYARAMGKWMLNCANACRLFFPDQLPDANQCLPGMQGYTNSIIGYEGLRCTEITGKYPVAKNASPVATGDGPEWNPKNPPESMFSVYSTSAVGLFAAIVDTTDVDGILRLDCNATDFYASKPYPEYLMYNPYRDPKEVTYEVSGDRSDLFDLVSRQYLAKNISDRASVVVPADAAVLVVELPADTRLRNREGKIYADNTIIAF